MWKCECKVKNSYTRTVCSNCNKPISQSIRNRIYIERLLEGTGALFIEIFEQFMHLLEKGYALRGKFKNTLFVIIKKIRNLVLKYKIIAVLLMFYLLISTVSLTNFSNNRIIRENHYKAKMSREIAANTVINKLYIIRDNIIILYKKTADNLITVYENLPKEEIDTICNRGEKIKDIIMGVIHND